VVERDALLKQLFIEHVCDSAEEADLDITERTDRYGYGDIIVSWSGMYLFVTYLE
jgi:hypothetical protein